MPSCISTHTHTHAHTPSGGTKCHQSGGQSTEKTLDKKLSSKLSRGLFGGLCGGLCGGLSGGLSEHSAEMYAADPPPPPTAVMREYFPPSGFRLVSEWLASSVVPTRNVSSGLSGCFCDLKVVPRVGQGFVRGRVPDLLLALQEVSIYAPPSLSICTCKPVRDISSKTDLEAPYLPSGPKWLWKKRGRNPLSQTSHSK